jgi:ADP-heptose:LPS heptosyltransferase
MLRRSDFFRIRNFIAAQIINAILWMMIRAPRNVPIVRQNVRTILVVMIAPFGDVLITMPALEALRRIYPGAHIVYLTTAEAAELARRMAVDEVIAISEDPTRLRGECCARADRWSALRRALKTLWQLRLRQFDLSIAFHPNLSFVAVQAFVNATVRTGPAFKGGGRLLTHVPTATAWQHIRERTVATLKLLEWNGDIGLTQLRLSPAEEAWRDCVMLSHETGPKELVIGLAPGAQYSSKQWPAERWAALANRILEFKNVRIILIGGKREKCLAQQIQRLTKRTLINSTGMADLGQTAALISRMDLLITVDSVARHLAASLSVPSMVLQYAGDRPTAWGRYAGSETFIRRQVSCSPCGKVICPNPLHDCMSLISVDQVFAEVEKHSLPQRVLQ